VAQEIVSIVLPTFNGSRYIRQAIKSCLDQTYTNIELIIVNDCSTDDTATIIEEYAGHDNRIKIIVNKENKKLPSSLNIGFQQALGQYFTWISDDNYFAPHAIDTLIKELQNSNGADIVYSSYYFIDEAGKPQDTFGSVPEELLFKCSPGACFLYKSEVHQELRGYDTRKFRMEDMDFWLRAATKFKYKYIDQRNLYFYRKHSNSLTASIFSNENIYKEYRKDHLLSFAYFFQQGLNYKISEEELNLHLELYFEDIIINKNWDYRISEKVIDYINYLDKLNTLNWQLIGFSINEVRKVINAKKERIISVVINDLVFENQLLQKKNPKLAVQLNRPVSWYYKEYEVLPSWYKKLGHILKAFQGNKSWRSLISNEKLT
jgi:glycosyltransferase involved in cell wall biosynthesis